MCTRKKYPALPCLFALTLSALVPGTRALAADNTGAADPSKSKSRMTRQVDNEMVVTALRTEKRSIDVPITTKVITQEDIELSGVIDLGDLISKHVTGHFHKFNGLLSPVGLRGFRTESHGTDLAGHVLILIDGHRIGTGNAAKINLDRIERMEVIKGPASALYGSAAMGGVINLITKKGDGKLGGSIGAEYGSFDYAKGLATAGGEVNEKFRFFVSASADTINDYDDPSYGTVYNTGVEKANFGGNVVYTFNEQHEIRLGGNYAHLTSESPTWLDGAYSAYNPDAQQNNNKSTGYADLEYNGDYFDGALHWKGLFYYLQDKNHWFWGAVDAESDQTKYIDKTLGTDHQFTWKMSRWNTLLAGFLVETMEKEAWGVNNYQPSSPYTPGMDYDNQALFVQDSLDLLDNRINVIVAGRYDRFKVTTKPAESGSYADFHERSEDYSHFSPKIGVGVKFFDERLRLRTNLGEGFKSPTADQLSADYVHSATGVHFLGNPNLDPETSITYGFGADLLLEAFTINLDWYHTDYADKIVQETNEIFGQQTTTFANHGDAVISGLDATLEWKLDKTFTLPFTASLWTNMTFNLDKEDKETGQDLLYISDYEIKSGIELGHGGLSAQLSHVLVGPQMITNYDSYLDEKKGSFDYWDLTIRYQFAEHWEIKGSVLNIFDQDVEWVRGYLMPERNYRIGLTYRF